MAERSPGSNRGRPSIDWEDAFAFYASLPDQDRSYQAVADHYAVSVRTVERHGRDGHWMERLSAIKADAADIADQQLVQSRAEKLADLELLIDASLASYAQQLRAGSVKVNPSDLLRLFKLREELWTQESFDHGVQAARQIVTDDPEDAERRKRELVAALDEAGAFERLRNFSSAQSESSDNVGSAEAA